MSIRNRITLLVALMLVAICSIGGYAVYQSGRSADEVKAVTEGVVPSALASAVLVSQLKDVQLAIMALASAEDGNASSQAAGKLAERKKALREALRRQSADAATDAQRGLLSQAEESLENYFSAIDETVKLKAANKNELAQANLFGNVIQYQAELEQIVETLRIEKNRAKDEAISVLNRNLADTKATVSAAAILAAVVLAAVGMLLYRRITGPISRMQAMMSEIASSQDFTRRVPVDRMDEIGRSIVAFNGMIEKIESSSAQLKQRTADIQAMLQNMPQGVLTVVDGVRIHHEYSAHLEAILETADIAGRSLMNLVFADCNLGADHLAQLDAACRACIGEDVMNFEFNKHLLAGEIEMRMPDGRIKVLDLSWSPIVDENDVTMRLMLCVRDTTELRKLAAEASEQKRKLEIIGEILAVPQEKFHEFIAGSIKSITENELLIYEHPQPDKDAIDTLFRNMHTVKGNARTFGLRHLTDVLHQAEQSYDELRQPRPQLAWDQGMLLEELAKVRKTFALYADLNEFSLGRKGPGRNSGAERYLLVDKQHIQETLRRLETVNTANLHELLSAHEAVRRILRLLGTESISDMLESVLDSLPSLAGELGKETPIVRVADNGYRIRSQAGALLKNVFMHLIRNAVDHGLETPEVRRLQGKPPAGTIRIGVDVVDGMLRIALSDDGRGLALARIRRIALERGLLSDGGSLADEELSRLIFRPGFSTASTVTEVSGRGVGMDAVLDFVRREHGGIEVRFTDERAGADYRQFEIIVSLPDSFVVHAGGDHAAQDSEDAPLPAAGEMDGVL